MRTLPAFPFAILLLSPGLPAHGQAGEDIQFHHVHMNVVDPERSAAFYADAFEQTMPRMTPADVRTLLAKFGLRADQVASRVDRLSPGERTRAAMALLQARGVNLLVLDEPTNHLDLPAIEQLEEALDSYDGALLLVSHDRRLLERVRLDHRWHVDAGRVST